MTAWTTNQIFAFGAVAVLLLGAANAIAAPAKFRSATGLWKLKWLIRLPAFRPSCANESGALNPLKTCGCRSKPF